MAEVAETGTRVDSPVTRNLPFDRIDHYASRYLVSHLLVTDTAQVYTIQPTCPLPFKLQRRTVSVSFPLVVTLKTERLPEQIHVVRSLISEDSSIVNSVDIVRWVTDPDITPLHFAPYRMAGLPCIGLRYPAHLILHSTSSSRRRR